MLTPAQRRTALRRALAATPCSSRKLAQAAGLTQSTITRALTNERPLTPDTAAALEAALRRWAAACLTAADFLAPCTEEAP